MSKQCLDVHQMKHLQEFGLKLKPSLVHYYKIINIDSGKWYLSVTTGDISEDSPTYQYIPAYTLQDVLDLLPKSIGVEYIYDLCIFPESISYTQFIGGEINDNLFAVPINESLIDAAYSMLCWCIENGYLDTNKNE